jgi:hypothetical protein
LEGTNGAAVEDNIAFDTAGHCFILRGSGDERNALSRNLGAKTRQGADSGDQAAFDSLPATYFVGNTNSTVTYNVGAGSQGVAFMIAEDSNQLNSSYAAVFQGNAAHSNNVVNWTIRR